MSKPHWVLWCPKVAVAVVQGATDELEPEIKRKLLNKYLQSPVILGFILDFIIQTQSQFDMSKRYAGMDIYDQLLAFVAANPLDFDSLSRPYDINKLELEKFTAQELKLKRREFQVKYWKDIEDVSKTWMENEYRVFIWFILAYSKMTAQQPEAFNSQDWQLIAQFFQKPSFVCQYFYLCCKKTKNYAWSTEEDQLIHDLMSSNISKKWTDIGLELFRLSEGKRFRKPKSIRERWLSHLNPNINKSGWTREEELELLQKIRECGKRWSKIAKMLGNRSEHTVKNRYNKLVQKLFREKAMVGDSTTYSDQKILELLASSLGAKAQSDASNKQSAIQQTIVSEPSIKLQETNLVVEETPPIHYFNPIILILSGILQ